MNKVFITSDTHFGHANIIKYCNRPFNTIQEMDEKLIENWNSVVSQQDCVYVLGDFCFSRTPEQYFNKLNGQKFLIKGNHDSRETYKLPWGFVKDVYSLRYDQYEIWLSHYAHRSWPKSFHGTLHFYGHAHGGMPPFGRSCDVGVDCWNYTPTNI
jgi:calcineurin-like phosphoesterase family protein